MRRVVKCEYTDLLTGETWVRIFQFDTASDERYGSGNEEIENAPLPDPKRRCGKGGKP